MTIRWIFLLAFLPALVACGGDDGSDGGASSSSGGGSGGGGGPKWRVVYSGDLAGEVSGGIMTVAGLGTNTMVAGAAMNEERTGSSHEFRVTITRYGEQPQASFTLDLPDGISCQDVTQMDPEPSEVDIIDSESDTFRAEITGTLYCGPERNQRIDYTAYLNADP